MFARLAEISLAVLIWVLIVVDWSSYRDTCGLHRAERNSWKEVCFMFYFLLGVIQSYITYNSCIATQSVNITIEACKPVIISAFWNNLCSELVTLKIETAFLPSDNEKNSPRNSITFHSYSFFSLSQQLFPIWGT